MNRYKINIALQRTIRTAVLLTVALVISGCVTPVGVRHIDITEANLRQGASVLTGDTLSAETAQILNRAGLEETFRTDPAQALAALRKDLPAMNAADRRFALAELSYLHARRRSDPSYFLASAVYAYTFLFPEKAKLRPELLDPRVRTAAEIYNQGLAAGLGRPEVVETELKAGTYTLPFGELAIAISPEEFEWGAFRLVDFVQASELDVRGLRNRYRWPGIGAALVASLERIPGKADLAYAKMPSNTKVPITAFLRLEDAEEALKGGALKGRLTLFSPDQATVVVVDGNKVPLEFELSAALAQTLEGSSMYELELRGLFSGDFSIFTEKAALRDGIFFMEPYRKGRIPVVFVHGTASSPARWAQMLNELMNDRELWGKYQFWFFTYNTGNPILYSAGLLTEGLRHLVSEIDPQGEDGALKRMVVIGHSQGGLLTKFTVVDSGTRFWDNTFNVPLGQMELSEETRELLQGSLFYKPLPFVKRAIFIATPHRGSFVAGGWIGKMAGKWISLPFRLLNPLNEIKGLLAAKPWAGAGFSLKDIPKSTDNMDPKSTFIKTFAAIPIAPGPKVHSIVAVENSDEPKGKWNDGVVAYESAHIDGVESELVVASGHSVQDTPGAIEEVRRILLRNLSDP